MLKKLEGDATEKPRTILPPLSATTVATILLVADSVAVLGSGYFTYDLLIVYSASQLYMATVLFVWLVTLSLMNFGGLYRYEVSTHPLRHFHAILIAVATSFLFLLAAAFSIKSSANFSRLWLASFAATSVVSLTLVRLGMSYVLARILRVRGSRRNLAVVGTGEQCLRITEMLAQMPDRPMRIQGIFTDTRHAVARKAGNRVVAIPPDGDLERLVSQTRVGLVDDVVIAIPWSEDDRIMNVVSKLRELPVNVYLVSDLIGFRTEFRSPPSHFGAMPILQIVGKPMSGWDAVIKAVEDYFLASLILILTAPLLVFIAAAIKLGSPGPVFFRQKRLGYNNQVFIVYKFRTMHHTSGPTGRTRQATPDDLRVTPLGRFLRRWSLDELPQIFNVLSGTMSLVGPRPHALDHNEQFARRAKGYFARHRVKPGITGLAQVRGYRGATDTEEKLEGRVRNDIFYAENWSLSLDGWILLRTLVICVSGNNAY